MADTTDDPADPVVADVMAGYGLIAPEIRQQVEAAAHQRPTHLFVQAGVGGLAAAAVAAGLHTWMAPPARIAVVEPAEAPCVAAALAAGRPVRVTGELKTAAEMLSCGEASRPALAVLLRHDVRVVTVPEATLIAAPHLLRDEAGPSTTPSGAAGLAGLIAVSADSTTAADLGLEAESRVLIFITEAETEG